MVAAGVPRFWALQPSLLRSQSRSCCSDKEISLPVLILVIPSTAATTANAQQQPQLPWSLIPVTAPLSLQSKESGT
nr:hypothetical protein Iba_chr06cCG16170 [Ipomoea batatas]